MSAAPLSKYLADVDEPVTYTFSWFCKGGEGLNVLSGLTQEIWYKISVSASLHLNETIEKWGYKIP